MNDSLEYKIIFRHLHRLPYQVNGFLFFASWIALIFWLLIPSNNTLLKIESVLLIFAGGSFFGVLLTQLPLIMKEKRVVKAVLVLLERPLAYWENNAKNIKKEFEIGELDFHQLETRKIRRDNYTPSLGSPIYVLASDKNRKLQPMTVFTYLCTTSRRIKKAAKNLEEKIVAEGILEFDRKLYRKVNQLAETDLAIDHFKRIETTIEDDLLMPLEDLRIQYQLISEINIHLIERYGVN